MKIDAMLGTLFGLVTCLFVCVSAGCGSEGTESVSEAGDAGTDAVPGEPTDGAADGAADAAARPADGGACFGASDVTEATCLTDCGPFAACALPGGGTCEQACMSNFSRKIVHECAAGANGDCAAMQACVSCGLVCTQAPKCNPPASAEACCNGCVSKPACYQPNELACDVIARCSS